MQRQSAFFDDLRGALSRYAYDSRLSHDAIGKRVGVSRTAIGNFINRKTQSLSAEALGKIIDLLRGAGYLPGYDAQGPHAAPDDTTEVASILIADKLDVLCRTLRSDLDRRIKIRELQATVTALYEHLDGYIRAIQQPGNSDE